MHRRGILLIDRGSREPEVKEELSELCSMTRIRGNYHHSTYSMLEVTRPYIEDGISECKNADVEYLTIVPYFLYPGLKMKSAVIKASRIAKDMNVRFFISRSLNYHPNLLRLVMDRIDEAKKRDGVDVRDSECDVLLVGHGSSDINARRTFNRVAHALSAHYRSVNVCFLELDRPDIREGILSRMNSSTLIIMPYFLHNGTHMKNEVKDTIEETIEYARNRYGFRGRAIITGHLGVSPLISDAIIDRAREVERSLASSR
mgnify:CR=1 FL=1